MSQSDPTLLRTCPDCGGILEPAQPGWIATIEVASSGVAPQDAAPDRWRCLLCGYQEDPAPLTDVDARPA